MVSVRFVVGFVVVFAVVIGIVVPVAFHFSRPKGQDSSSNTTTTMATSGSSSASTTRGTTGARGNTSAIPSTTTSRPRSSTTSGSVSTSTPTTLPTIPPNATMTLTNYTAALTSSSPTFCYSNDCTNAFYFYEAILLNVSVNGNYTMKCSSSMDTFGFLYQDNFEPLSPFLYLLKADDDSGGNYNFLISNILLGGRTYILVATTYDTNVTGSFRIGIWGVAPVQMRTYSAVYTYPTMTVYPSVLNRTSRQFNPDNSSGTQNYYYQAFLISVSVPGHYFIRSNSSMDTYGLLYTGTFSPSNVLQNQFGRDDDSGGNYQFGFALLIDTSSSYIVVATTFGPNVIGFFSMVAYGQGPVVFNPI